MSSKETGTAAGEPISVLCMACADEKCDFKPVTLKRRGLTDYDVLIDMKYCGICHTDLHIAANHIKLTGGTKYPVVPGHELSGVCTAVGSKVTKFKVGDHVGVGCMVDSCLECAACKRGEEQFCRAQVSTYNGDDKHGRAAVYPPGSKTLGGYTNKMVVHERFGILIPKTYPLECAGPVMCSGVTLFDPLRRHGATKGTRVAIVGLGGLGQMGIQLAKAFGCEVTAISRGASKEVFAKRCGAKHYIVSSAPAQMEAAKGSLDLIINTIPAAHDYDAYSKLLAPGGKQVLLGIHSGFIASMVVSNIVKSKVVPGMIGSIEATQAVIDFCDKNKIFPEVKMVGVEEINRVYEELDDNNDSGVRYVINIEKSLNESAAAKCTAPAPKLKPSAGGMTAGSVVLAVLDLLCCLKWY